MVHFLYAPGTNSHLPQLARYCDNVTYEDGNRTYPITHNYSFPFIREYTCVKFPEFDIDIPKQYPIIRPFTYVGCLIKDKFTLTNSNGYNFMPMMNRFCMGQTADVNCVQNAYLKTPPNEKLVAFGVSRGVPSLINWYHTFGQKVNGFIFEGGQSTIDNLAKHSNTYYYDIVKKLAPYVTSYDPNDLNVMENLLSLPKDVPILFIHSKNDTTVPYECGYEMYRILSNNGYDNVKFVTLKNANHNDYISNNLYDRMIYTEAVDEFIKKLI